MKHIQKRYIAVLGVALLVIAGIVAVILSLSSDGGIGDREIKGNLLLMADGVFSIRETQAQWSYSMAFPLFQAQ